ncbi:hypothetical protein [Sulfurimonas sp. HSL-1716]|uniref:hypothetical protein n=1 Tax=Hydrocurvibacter sulfurireducens TaxID=3131937 RepID=UPI0031F92638
MLDSELKFYLKAHLGKPSVGFKLSEAENNKLFAYFNEHCEEGCLQDPKSQQKIKQAFKEYFEPVGYILFKLTENKILLKVFAYKIEPKDSINLPAVLEILSLHKDLIQYDYKGNKNQISIPSKLKKKIYDFVKRIKNEEIHKKELIRFAVNEFFELHDHDIVIIKEDQIFVKKLDEKYKRKVSENEKNTIANRYNGINEEELKSLYDDFFSKEENKSFFYYVAKLFVTVHMIEKKIDNHTYEQKVFSIIQSIIAEQLNNTYNRNKDFCTGFAGYIFRVHFEEVFGHIASLILTEIAISNEYMMDFLKYYSLNVIVIDGKKYKVPELETESGLKWNVVSMLSIVKIYVKIKSSVDILKKEIDELDKKIKVLYIGEFSPLEYQNKLQKEKEEIEHILTQEKKKLDRVQDTLLSVKNEQRKFVLTRERLELKEIIQKKRDEKAQIIAQTVQKSVITQYNNLRKTLDTLMRQLHRNEKVLEQNRPSYLSIKNALAKALVSKKTLL